MKGLMTAALALCPVSLWAGAECMPEPMVMQVLSDYGEQPVMTGDFEVNGQTARVAVFVNPETGTWTYVGQPAAGVLCVIDHGGNAALHEVTEGEGL